ncbi:MAG: PEP-CTERM sorting domain-containing protein [Sedimentisphaerales bacterium]|nr:PEP-CTERM sorting domain-containing protein [Sedimentisphaerales bacterium]
MKGKRTGRTVWAVLILLLYLGAKGVLALPPEYYRGNLPDFSQKQRDWKDVNGTWTFCGPASAANSLLWMSDHYNLPKLRQWLNGSEYDNNGDMIQNVADYMGFVKRGTIDELYWDPPGGVSADGFIGGKEKYLEARYPWIEQKVMQAPFKAGSDLIYGKDVTGTPPTLDWIKGELDRGEDVEVGFSYLVKVGWDPELGDCYSRQGGHWMTFAGWNASQLILHDPAQDVNFAGAIKVFPGTPFEHWAYPDHHDFATWTFGGKNFLALPDYKSGCITVMDVAVSESIPEPCSLLLLSLGGLAMMRKRRGRVL